MLKSNSEVCFGADTWQRSFDGSKRPTAQSWYISVRNVSPGNTTGSEHGYTREPCLAFPAMFNEGSSWEWSSDAASHLRTLVWSYWGGTLRTTKLILFQPLCLPVKDHASKSTLGFHRAHIALWDVVWLTVCIDKTPDKAVDKETVRPRKSTKTLGPNLRFSWYSQTFRYSRYGRPPWKRPFWNWLVSWRMFYSGCGFPFAFQTNLCNRLQKSCVQWEHRSSARSAETGRRQRRNGGLVDSAASCKSRFCFSN